jgi:hypothetical protein
MYTYPLKTSLKAFLSNATDEKEFRITTDDVAHLARSEVEEINAIIERERKLDGSSGFRVEPAVAGGDLVIYKDPKMERNTLGAPERTEPPREDKFVDTRPNNPFRPRYRKLAPNELQHHDDIKRVAMDLLELIRYVPKVRSEAGNSSSGEELANCKLSERHLEDAVYRAVKALTA